MTDPSPKDPAELWVVILVSKTTGKPYPTGVHLVRRDALDDARQPEGLAIDREHVTCYVPKPELELRDRRIAELEHQAALKASREHARIENCQHRYGADGYCKFCGVEG